MLKSIQQGTHYECNSIEDRGNVEMYSIAVYNPQKGGNEPFMVGIQSSDSSECN